MLHHDKVISAIGREVILGQDADGNMVMPGQRNFMITIPNLSKTACVAMLSHPFKKEEHLGLLKIMLAVSDKTETFEWGGSNPLPITPKTATPIQIFFIMACLPVGRAPIEESEALPLAQSRLGRNSTCFGFHR